MTLVLPLGHHMFKSNALFHLLQNLVSKESHDSSTTQKIIPHQVYIRQYKLKEVSIVTSTTLNETWSNTLSTALVSPVI